MMDYDTLKDDVKCFGLIGAVVGVVLLGAVNEALWLVWYGNCMDEAVTYELYHHCKTHYTWPYDPAWLTRWM